MMKNNLVRVICVLLVLFHVDHFEVKSQVVVGTPVNAETYAATITSEELKKHLEILASDEYEGRETGMPGQKKAAQYLADYYTTLGVMPIVKGSWFQKYPLKRESYLGSVAESKERKYKFIDDYYFFGSDTPELNADQIVFVGYGIDDKNYSDYKKVDVTGKVVMCLMGEPIDKKGRSRITKSGSMSVWSEEWELKVSAAQERGAIGMLMINADYAEYMKRVRYWLEQAPMRLDRKEEPVDQHYIPLIFISPDMARAIFKGSSTDPMLLQQEIDKKGKTRTRSTTTSLVFHMEPQRESLEAENVLCFIEGTDPLLKNEIVVISAHYDHIGIVNGQINNGADDDGSGTVGTLELAEAFNKAKKEGNGTRRSILILNVSGEEKGLLGSEWYASDPVFPLANTVCDLNIDMIGRKDAQHPDPNYVYLIGSDKLSTDLHKISEECNKKHTSLALDYTYNHPDDPNRFYYRSDHYNFAKNNIPVIFYFSGVHEDYHKPGDDHEKILYDKMETIVKLVFHTAWEVANREERLKVDVINDFQEH